MWLIKTCALCLNKGRPRGVGTRDLYEDGGAEESGDGVRTEGLHRSGDVSDAGGGGHLQGPGEQHAGQPKPPHFAAFVCLLE